MVAVLAVYFAYIWGPGRHAAESESWGRPLRRWTIWKHFKDYFSARLVKSTDLDPSHKYIFAVHPHGIAACSAWINFATNQTGFDELFPGIRCFCLTLENNFRALFVREYCLAHGLRSASRRSAVNILGGKPGAAIVLVVGGAAESLVAAPGTYDLVLGKRKGFVRIALETGASLVPVLCYGENDLFYTHVPPKGSALWRFQQHLKSVLGFATPFFWGVGLFSGTGLVARRVPLTTVVGEPLKVERYNGSTSSEEYRALVDKYHTSYLQALQTLWETTKDVYGCGYTREMQILD